MASAQPPAPDSAFAALALLRCRDRLEQILGTIAEPRRSEIECAVKELAGLDDSRLRALLAEVVHREDGALADDVARALGADAAGAPLAIRRWIARCARP